MPFRYKINIRDALRSAGYTSYRIRKEKILGERYMQQIRKGDMVPWNALDRICCITKRQVGDLVEWIPGDDKNGSE